MAQNGPFDRYIYRPEDIRLPGDDGFGQQVAQNPNDFMDMLFGARRGPSQNGPANPLDAPVGPFQEVGPRAPLLGAWADNVPPVAGDLPLTDTEGSRRSPMSVGGGIGIPVGFNASIFGPAQPAQAPPQTPAPSNANPSERAGDGIAGSSVTSGLGANAGLARSVLGPSLDGVMPRPDFGEPRPMPRRSPLSPLDSSPETVYFHSPARTGITPDGRVEFNHLGDWVRESPAMTITTPPPPGTMYDHRGQAVPDTPENRLATYIENARRITGNNVLRDYEDRSGVRVSDTPMSVQRRFDALMPSLLQNFQAMEQARLRGQELHGLPGTNIPGSIQNNATEAYSRLLQQQNTPRAEDVAADQAAEGRIQEVRRLRGMTEEQAVEELRRTDPSFRMPRRLGGGANPLPTTPPWMNSGMPPMPSMPGLMPMGGAGPLPPSAVPGPSFRGPPQPQSALPQLLSEANSLIPTSVDAQGRQVRNTYQQSPDAYLNAITRVMEGMPENELRGGLSPQQRNTLAQQFGGTEALDNWLNTSNIPIRNLLSAEHARRQRAIQRYLRLNNMAQSPITPLTENAGMLPRAISGASMTNPATGAAAALNYFGLNPLTR